MYTLEIIGRGLPTLRMYITFTGLYEVFFSVILVLQLVQSQKAKHLKHKFLEKHHSHGVENQGRFQSLFIVFSFTSSGFKKKRDRFPNFNSFLLAKKVQFCFLNKRN
jgi:hypothetical protein